MKYLLIGFLGLLFLGLGVALTLVYINYNGESPDNGSQASNNSGLIKSSGEFKDKLAELKIKRDKALTQIKRLEQRKDEAADRLRSKGVRNVGDIKSDDRESRLLIAELRDLVKNQDNLQKDIKIYDDAIVSIEAILRKFDRDLVMSGSGNNEEQEAELRKIILNVEDKLTGDRTILDELEEQDLLDQILSDSKSNKK